MFFNKKQKIERKNQALSDLIFEYNTATSLNSLFDKTLLTMRKFNVNQITTDRYKIHIVDKSRLCIVEL